MIIQSHCLTTSELTKSQSTLLRASSKCLLTTDGLGAPTTSLGTLFQGLTTLSVKKHFLTSSLNPPSAALSHYSSSDPVPSPGTHQRSEVPC